MKIRYFDHAATTAVKEEVLKEMLPYFSILYGNASSIYSIGRESKKAIEEARRKVARAIGAKKSEIYFTGCGSECDNLIIKGITHHYREKGNHIITSKIEHPAVLNTCKALEKEGYIVTYLNVTKEGKIDLGQLESSITDSTILISIMAANNEIGTIQPLKQIGEIAKRHGVIFHSDAVQAIGNINLNVKELGIDALSISAHKFYGPKGVGSLYVREGIEFDRIQDGGHQEKNKRSGTENVAGIVGLGKAIELAIQDQEKYSQRLRELRDYTIKKIEEAIPEAVLNGDPKDRLPGNINFAFPEIDGEELLLKLDERGICASTGSACSSGDTKPSHVLLAIGLGSNLAKGSLRISLGDENTKEDMDFLIDSLKEIIAQMKGKEKALHD